MWLPRVLNKLRHQEQLARQILLFGVGKRASNLVSFLHQHWPSVDTICIASGSPPLKKGGPNSRTFRGLLWIEEHSAEINFTSLLSDRKQIFFFATLGELLEENLLQLLEACAEIATSLPPILILTAPHPGYLAKDQALEWLQQFRESRSLNVQILFISEYCWAQRHADRYFLSQGEEPAQSLAQQIFSQLIAWHAFAPQMASEFFENPTPRKRISHSRLCLPPFILNKSESIGDFWQDGLGDEPRTLTQVETRTSLICFSSQETLSETLLSDWVQIESALRQAFPKMTLSTCRIPFDLNTPHHVFDLWINQLPLPQFIPQEDQVPKTPDSAIEPVQTF